MTTRKHRSQEEWQAIIQQQKDSGLSAIKFCQQQGLSSKTFYKRRRAQCAVLGNDASPSSFIKIKKPSPPVVTRPSEPMSVLHYHHCQLHIQSGTDVRWLAGITRNNPGHAITRVREQLFLIYVFPVSQRQSKNLLTRR